MGAVEVQGGRPELENHPRFIFKGESNSGRPLFEVWPPSGKPSRKGVQTGLKLLLVYTWFFVTSIFVFRVSCSGKTFLLNISMRNTPSNGQPLKGNTLPRFSKARDVVSRVSESQTHNFNTTSNQSHGQHLKINTQDSKKARLPGLAAGGRFASNSSRWG